MPIPHFLRARHCGAALASLIGLACGQQAAGQVTAPPAPPTAAAMPAPGASTPVPPRNPPAGVRMLSPAEQRDSATMPGELRPEQPAKPQINIPLGKTPPPAAKPQGRASQPDRPRAGTVGQGDNDGVRSGMDDAVARCEAQTDVRLRERCRAALAKQGSTR